MTDGSPKTSYNLAFCYFGVFCVSLQPIYNNV